MTDILRYIKATLGRGVSQFLVPARLLREEDRPLLQHDALVFRGKYLSKITCPECGKLVEVRRRVDERNEPHYSVLCPHCEVLEERSVAPEEVELLKFQIRAFKHYVDNPAETGDYVEEAAACLPVQAVGEPSSSQGNQAQLQVLRDSQKRLEANSGAILHFVSSGEQGKPLSHKRQVGDVRHKMIQEGYELVRSGDLSDTDAARKMIQAYQGTRGAYSENGLDALRRAIARERKLHGLAQTTRKRGKFRT